MKNEEDILRDIKNYVPEMTEGEDAISFCHKMQAGQTDISKPFNEDILAAATERAKNYIIKIEPNEDLGFVGHSMKFPTVFGDGKTKEECRNNVREAIVAAISTMIEMGREEFIPD